MISNSFTEISSEYLLNPENNRLTIYPIKNTAIWDSYKKQQAAFWTAEEIDFSKDYNHFIKLSTNEQHFIKMILAFFSSADTIVNINLGERFLNDVKIREAITTYTFQMMIENVHAETYSLQIDNIIRDTKEKDKLFNAVKEFPCIAEKAAWAVKWIESTDSFAKRLIAFVIVEGIFFSGAFCSIFWLKKKNIMPGLCASNELIARDEGMHCISKGTLVSINGFESLPIEELLNNSNVLSYTENDNGMIYCNQTNFKYQGKKKCIELLFEDGRLLSCTPDHRILTKEGWKEAQHVILNKDKILVSPENPYFIHSTKDLEDEKKWKLNIGKEYIFSTNNINNTKKACAFARILGYTQSNILYIKHQIDNDSLKYDIKLAFNETFDKVYIKSKLKKILNTKDMIPSFIMSAPRIIIAHFLAGLFGRYGSVPFNENKEHVFNKSIKFIFRKNDNVIATENQNKILKLLDKFDIKGRAIQEQINQDKKNKVTKYTIIINSKYITKFYKNIGFAYCIFKHTKASVLSSLINSQSHTKLNEKELLESWGIYKYINHITFSNKIIPCMEIKVINRKDVGELDTYDITIDKTHNFTANGVVVHNCEFAVLLYSMLVDRIVESEIHSMFREAVDIERKFICESLPCALLGMNADMMNQYIKFVADRLLVTLGYNKIFNVTNPFDFMESISIEGKTNFFEHRPTQYQNATVLNKTRDSTFELTEDF